MAALVEVVLQQLRELRRAWPSAFIVAAIALCAGFYLARLIYQDQATFWEHAYTQRRTEETRGLSDKALKVNTLNFVDLSEQFLSEEARHPATKSLFHYATESVTNAVDPGTLKCEARRRDAIALRDEILLRIPIAYRDSTATAAYSSGECLQQLRPALKDLRDLAMRLRDQ